MESTLGVKYDLILARRSQVLTYARNFLQACLQVPAMSSFKQKKKEEKKMFSCGNARPLLTHVFVIIDGDR